MIVCNVFGAAQYNQHILFWPNKHMLRVLVDIAPIAELPVVT
jgi:hypothetical protein